MAFLKLQRLDLCASNTQWPQFLIPSFSYPYPLLPLKLCLYIPAKLQLIVNINQLTSIISPTRNAHVFRMKSSFTLPLTFSSRVILDTKSIALSRADRDMLQYGNAFNGGVLQFIVTPVAIAVKHSPPWPLRNVWSVELYAHFCVALPVQWNSSAIAPASPTEWNWEGASMRDHYRTW